MLLPGEESPRHEEAVEALEVQPSQGSEAGQEGQQRGLGDAAPRQSQALQLGAQAKAHLKQHKRNMTTHPSVVLSSALTAITEKF